MFEIKITADTLPELASAILAVAEHYRVTLGGESAPNEKPKPRRKASTDGEAANTAASEPSTPNTSTLEPADENPTTATQNADTATETAGSIAIQNSDPAAAGPSRDDVLTAATKFSQKHGADALMAAINSIEGAKKFSDIAATDYPAFLAAMEKHEASASALS